MNTSHSKLDLHRIDVVRFLGKGFFSTTGGRYRKRNSMALRGNGIARRQNSDQQQNVRTAIALYAVSGGDGGSRCRGAWAAARYFCYFPLPPLCRFLQARAHALSAAAVHAWTERNTAAGPRTSSTARNHARRTCAGAVAAAGSSQHETDSDPNTKTLALEVQGGIFGENVQMGWSAGNETKYQVF